MWQHKREGCHLDVTFEMKMHFELLCFTWVCSLNAHISSSRLRFTNLRDWFHSLESHQFRPIPWPYDLHQWLPLIAHSVLSKVFSYIHDRFNTILHSNQHRPTTRNEAPPGVLLVGREEQGGFVFYITNAEVQQIKSWSTLFEVQDFIHHGRKEYKFAELSRSTICGFQEASLSCCVLAISDCFSNTNANLNAKREGEGDLWSFFHSHSSGS